MSFSKNIFLLLFFLTGFKAFSQTVTPNIGFEDGYFTNWQISSGTVDVNGIANLFQTAQPVIGRETIIGKQAEKILDPYGLFPIFCPNGSNYSIMLGNDVPAKKADRVSYTFTVPNLPSYSIIFNYAVVLNNPVHLNYQQPKFSAHVYDVTDDEQIECPAFDFVAGSALPGFKLSSKLGPQNSQVYYKEWSTATIDLHNYAGKSVEIQFTVNDCTLGGHFGYVYLDVQDNTTSHPITGNAYCLGQKSITLYGPNGFSDYYWYNADLTKKIGQGQSIKISPAPPDNTVYALQIFPYPDLGCVDTLYTTVNKINDGFNLVVPDTVRGCPGTGADLTAASVTAGSSPMTFSYFTDSLATSYLYNPDVITKDGSYYIQGVNAEGCQAIVPVYVKLGLPTIKVLEPAAVEFPLKIDLTTTYVHVLGLTYAYFSDSTATVPLDNYNAIKYSGTYYIKATNIYGCSVVAAVQVTVHPPPQYKILAPNTFTPNGDGINDRFSVSYTGIVSFGSLKIFNRYGQQIAMLRSFDSYWDGTLNGQQLPAGTYYWVFEGEDDYNNVKINKAGSITLLR